MPAVLPHDDAHLHPLGAVSVTLRSFGDFLMRPRAQYWLARLYVCISVLTTAAFGYLSPLSVQRVVLDNAGESGWILLGCVFGVAVIGLLDSIVNDLMPARFRIRWTDLRRHQVYMALSLMLGTLVWLNVVHGQGMLPAIRYSIDCLACMFIAVFDTVARAREVSHARLRRRSGV